MNKRIFLVVLDSVGIGKLPDASTYGDEGSNTLAAVASSSKFNIPNMKNLGFFNIDGVNCRDGVKNPQGSFARMTMLSKGKDTIVGHWEIAGLISSKPLPTYPQGFPKDLIHRYCCLTGKNIICNKPYSGTKVLDDYGKEHVETGALIVYTSADSVLQVAAHEEHCALEELYRYCQIAREMMCGKHGVGRVIARPFTGEYPNYVHTSNRRDFSLVPQSKTMLNYLSEAGYDTIGVGKIFDIFAGSGISKKIKTSSNHDGMNKAIELATSSFEGLCFVNLVDFDMMYGHRNDVDGYAQAMSDFDSQLEELVDVLNDDDVLIITADHGCDPLTPSSDHSREYTPMIIFGNHISKGVNMGTLPTFADIGATVLDYFGLKPSIEGESFLKLVTKEPVER